MALKGIPTDLIVLDDQKDGRRNARSWVLWFNDLFNLLRGMTTGDWGVEFPQSIVMANLVPANFPNDAVAALNGVPLGGVYHTAGVLHIRIV
jgi:hypothetical protein